MTDKEQIKFLFKFDSQYTTTPPIVEIVNNGIQVVSPQEIDKACDVEIIVDLDISVSNCLLEIKRSNHDGSTPQTLNLVGIFADDIDLNKVLNHSKFYPEYPELWYSEQLAQGTSWPEFHYGWLSWGWNGTWQMSYATPFYDWLLKEL
jgi:hypothetical protein